MQPLSIRLSPELHQALVKKSKELGHLKLSDTVRVLLSAALEKDNLLKKRQLQYLAGTYYLLHRYIAGSGESGVKVNEEAHALAAKVAEEFFN